MRALSLVISVIVALMSVQPSIASQSPPEQTKTSSPESRDSLSELRQKLLSDLVHRKKNEESRPVQWATPAWRTDFVRAVISEVSVNWPVNYALDQGKEVAIYLTISRKGFVLDSRIMASSGDKEFDARALGAVRKTKQLSAVSHLSDEEFDVVRVLNIIFRPEAPKN